MRHSFRYCPSCGTDGLTFSSNKSVLCAECGFEYFFNAAGAVAGLIVNDHKELLVTVRGDQPGKGLLDLPGGFIDAGESAEQALRREVKEELNLQVENLEYFASAANSYCYKQITYPTIDIAYLCQVADFTSLKIMDEVESVRFLSFEQLRDADFGFESIRFFVELFLERDQRAI